MVEPQEKKNVTLYFKVNMRYHKIEKSELDRISIREIKNFGSHKNLCYECLYWVYP